MIDAGRRLPSSWVGLALCVLGLALSVPPSRSLIEQSMAWHMVVQMTMLVAAGWWLIHGHTHGPSRPLFGDWNQFGLTGFMASQLIAAYWMLPVAIDRAVVLPQVDVFKVATLMACGAALNASFERSPAILQLFFVGYGVSMLISAGVFLATTDRRLCNADSLESQFSAGSGVVALGIALGSAWAVQAYRSTGKR